LGNRQAVEEGIIKALKKKSDPEIEDDVMMIMIPSEIDYLTRINKKRLAQYNMGIFNSYRIKTLSDVFLNLAGPFLGAPHAVMGMEKLIALGAKRFWVMGWCGSLNPELRIGDLVIPSSAISEEGTSAHYPIESDLKTDAQLNELLEQYLLKKGHLFQKGLLWTTDAPYRETPEKIKAYQKKGALAVEMEMSALVTVSIFRQVKLTGLLVVSDELFDLKWNPGFSNPKLKQGSRLACEILTDLVKSLHG
jgi:purine-nucleoside phosphorylase